MSSKNTIPEEIKQYKPCKCCKIRCSNGIYYVYKYKAVKLESGKWGTDQGYLIGKILPSEGFIPNKRYIDEIRNEKTNELDNKINIGLENDTITDVAYGQYALLIQLSTDIKQKLKDCFPLEKAIQIYCYGLILCANGFIHVDQVNEFYDESILSVIYEGYSFKMGYTALTNLLHDLGMRGNPVKKFEQNLIDTSSKNIAIDGHVIRSCSEENDLAEPGYKLNLLKAPQVNVLIAYDIKNKIPLLYRTFRGTSIDKKSVKDILTNRSFTNTKFIVDCGFYSATVLNQMKINGNSYIIPVPSSNENYKRIRRTLQFSSGEFVYKSGKNDSARIVYYEEQIDVITRIIVYKDIDENNSKRKSYKINMDMGENGYTQDGYDEYCETWGVYYLQTTTNETPSEVFADYKGRWSIETYNNNIKNDAEFKNLKIQDYYIQHGFDFIMLVTGLIHSRLNDAVKNLKKSDISIFDILIKAGHIRMVKNDKSWKIQNTRTKDLKLLSLMGFEPQIEFALSKTC